MSFVASLFVLALANEPAPAAQAVDPATFSNTTVTRYPVGGATPGAVRAAMNAVRPEQDGRRFDAKTTWRYSTRWRTGPAGECDPASAEVGYAITIILPELVDGGRLGPRDRARWDRYLAALTAHEANHAGIVIVGAQRMQAAMRAATSCRTMEAAVRGAEADVIAANRVYDARTRNGHTEGATYP